MAGRTPAIISPTRRPRHDCDGSSCCLQPDTPSVLRKMHLQRAWSTQSSSGTLRSHVDPRRTASTTRHTTLRSPYKSPAPRPHVSQTAAQIPRMPALQPPIIRHSTTSDGAHSLRQSRSSVAPRYNPYIRHHPAKPLLTSTNRPLALLPLLARSPRLLRHQHKRRGRQRQGEMRARPRGLL